MSLTDPIGPGGGVDLSTGFGGATGPKPGDVLTRNELERLIQQEGIDSVSRATRNNNSRSLTSAVGGVSTVALAALIVAVALIR